MAGFSTRPALTRHNKKWHSTVEPGASLSSTASFKALRVDTEDWRPSQVSQTPVDSQTVHDSPDLLLEFDFDAFIHSDIDFTEAAKKSSPSDPAEIESKWTPSLQPNDQKMQTSNVSALRYDIRRGKARKTPNIMSILNDDSFRDFQHVVPETLEEMEPQHAKEIRMKKLKYSSPVYSLGHQSGSAILVRHPTLKSRVQKIVEVLLK